MPEIYFAQSKSALTNNKVEELTRTDYVERLYTASASGKKGFYLVGVASRPGPMIPEKRSDDGFTVPAGEVLFDFKKEPTYISVMWSLDSVRKPKLKFLDSWKDADGLRCLKYHSRSAQSPSYYHLYKSRIVRVVLSEILPERTRPQALILEFDGIQSSAKDIMAVVKNNMEKNSIPVIDSESFSLLGKDMKKYPA